MIKATTIDFTVGSRRLLSVGRELATWSFTLEEVLSARTGPFTPALPGRDGLRVLSAPQHAFADITACFPDYIVGGRQDYQRHYIAMTGSYADYLERFSSKTRSTLRRKGRKLTKETGGYTITEHRSPAEVEHFLDAALPLSAKTYQARLLDAGLPGTPAARTQMLEAAEDNRMRCFLLNIADAPVAYLSLPVSGRTLVYAHLGYDPEFARLSPGTILQLGALERLFAEERFAYFDFTEGDGAHKSMFGTNSVDCSSFVMLDPSLANRALLGARTSFDGVISGAKALANRSGALSRVRAILRA